MNGGKPQMDGKEAEMKGKSGTGFSLDPSMLSFNLPGLSFAQVEEKPPVEEPVEEEKPSIRITHRYGHRHISRKAASEAALSDQLDWHFKGGGLLPLLQLRRRGQPDVFQACVAAAARALFGPVYMVHGRGRRGRPA